MVIQTVDLHIIYAYGAIGAPESLSYSSSARRAFLLWITDIQLTNVIGCIRIFWCLFKGDH